MFKKIFKKEEVQYTPKITQNEDWTKDIRRSKKISQEVEQLTLFNDNKSINVSVFINNNTNANNFFANVYQLELRIT